MCGSRRAGVLLPGAVCGSPASGFITLCVCPVEGEPGCFQCVSALVNILVRAVLGAAAQVPRGGGAGCVREMAQSLALQDGSPKPGFPCGCESSWPTSLPVRDTARLSRGSWVSVSACRASLRRVCLRGASFDGLIARYRLLVCDHLFTSPGDSTVGFLSGGGGGPGTSKPVLRPPVLAPVVGPRSRVLRLLLSSRLSLPTVFTVGSGYGCGFNDIPHWPQYTLSFLLNLPLVLYLGLRT